MTSRISATLFDRADSGDPLIVTETVISRDELLADNAFDVDGRVLTSITLSNRSNTDGGVAILAISAVATPATVFADGFE